MKPNRLDKERLVGPGRRRVKYLDFDVAGKRFVLWSS